MWKPKPDGPSCVQEHVDQMSPRKTESLGRQLKRPFLAHLHWLDRPIVKPLAGRESSLLDITIRFSSKATGETANAKPNWCCELAASLCFHRVVLAFQDQF